MFHTLVNVWLEPGDGAKGQLEIERATSSGGPPRAAARGKMRLRRRRLLRRCWVEKARLIPTHYDITNHDMAFVGRNTVEIGLNLDPDGFAEYFARCSLLHITKLEDLQETVPH